MDFLASLILVVVSDLFEGEFMEDAFLMGEAFYVIAESPDGRRWRHERTFTGEGLAARDRAGERAERLRATIELALDHGNWKGPKGNAHWNEITPCYGSSAYAANWRAYAAQDNLAEGNFDTAERESELRERASGA
jgi:hypothetical protein